VSSIARLAAAGFGAIAVPFGSGASTLPFDIATLFYVVGFTGLLTGDAVVRIGLIPTLLAVLACLVAACALLGVTPRVLAASGSRRRCTGSA
jgi:hypothetical protein